MKEGRERDGISFMREIATKPSIKFKYPNFKVSYIIYNNFFFINKKNPNNKDKL